MSLWPRSSWTTADARRMAIEVRLVVCLLEERFCRFDDMALNQSESSLAMPASAVVAGRRSNRGKGVPPQSLMLQPGFSRSIPLSTIHWCISAGSQLRYWAGKTLLTDECLVN